MKSKIMRNLRLLRNKEVLLRIFADIILVNFSLFLVLFICLLTNGIWWTVLDVREMLVIFLKISPLLTLTSEGIFFIFGFYTYGRGYRGRYKILFVIEAVTIVYLLCGFVLYPLKFLPNLPTPVWGIGWLVTASILSCARVLSLIYWNIAKTERKKMNLKGDKPIEDVLVIGGGGYIGSVLTKKLLARGYKVRVLDLFLYGEDSIKKIADVNLEVMKGDFRHIDKVVEGLEDVDAVVHLGAIVGDQACALNEKVTLETNLLATRFISEGAKAFSCQRFIFASTCSVYGASSSPLTEDSPPRPLSLYATTKLLAEDAVLKLGGNGFVPVILRFATVYGPSLRPRFDLVVNTLSAMAAVDGKITVFGGEQWRPLVHIDDVTDAIILALEAPRRLVAGEVFNVGNTKENYQIKDIGEIIKRLTPNAEVLLVMECSDKRNYFVSFAKIERVLGFQTKKTVADGVGEIITAVSRGEIENYKDIRFNNFSCLVGNGYTKEVKWCDLLNVLRSW